MSELIKTQENGLVVPTALKEMQTTLKSFTPKTKNDAIRMLAFLSAATNTKDSERIKKECYSFLSNRCAECENAVDPETGIEVTRVERETKVYNDSEDVASIEKKIEELKAKLAKAKEKAGVAYTNISVYYKVSWL